MSRALTVLVGLVLIAIVACSPSAPQAPEISAETESELAADAAARACEAECEQFTIYIHDKVFTHDTLLDDAEPISPSTIEAIRDRLGDVEFVDQEEADALFGDDGLVDGGHGVLLSIGPIEVLAEDVVGIEVGLVIGNVGGRGQMVQFQWNGEAWMPATSEDTGVTVVSWVS